jgi:hypothetical protein
VAVDSGCYLSALTRTNIGTYKLGNAWTLEEFEKYLVKMKQNGNFYV